MHTNGKTEKALNKAVHKVMNQDLPLDPVLREAERERRRLDIDASTKAILLERGEELPEGLHFFGRQNEELEKQVFAWVLQNGKQPFMQCLMPHLLPELFDCYCGNRLMRFVHDRYEKEGYIPTPGLIIRSLSRLDDIEAGYYDKFLDWVNTKPDPGVYDFLTGSGEDGLLAQLKYRAYDHVLKSPEVYDLLEARDFDQLDTIFPRCFPNPSQSKRLSFKRDADRILAKTVIQSIGVGYPTLDNVMHEHGAARGELLLWLGNTGDGKTTLMLNCTWHAMRQGYKVAYITLEGTSAAVAQRLASLMGDIPTRTLHDHVAVAKRAIHSPPGDVEFLQPPENERWGVRDVSQQLDYLRNTESWVPDVIVIDYAQLLRHVGMAKQDPEYMKIAKTMDSIKRLALDTNTLVITAQQANREGESAEIVKLRHAAGSYDALQPCDYVLSVNKTINRAGVAMMKLAVGKNRHGREDAVAFCSYNAVSGRVEE